MLYPGLKTLPRTRQRLNVFYGCEPRGSVRPGAFSDALNLCSEGFPALRVRRDRKRYYRGLRGPGGQSEELVISPDSPVTAAAEVNGTLALASQNKLYYRGLAVENAPLDPAAERRAIIPFGRDLFVVPDGKFVQTDETGVKGVRHAAFTQTLAGASVCYADDTGAPVAVEAAYPLPPVSPAEGDQWIDVSSGYPVLRRFTGGAWDTVSPVYLKISHTAAARCAVPGDKLRVEGIEDARFTAEAATTLPGALLLRTDRTDLLPGAYIVLVKKTMPALDFAVEHLNRIWGCRFGRNAAGEFVNEIYASAPGDPTVWDRFAGLSTDCYAAGLGCPGEFTGAAVTGGELIFFKEQFIIRVSGETPQDFTVRVTPARGVKKGFSDTLAVLGEKIYYVSEGGVTVYDGALPYAVSQELPAEDFTDARAAAGNGKYYLAARRGETRRVYVFDPERGLWHAEDDDANVRFFVRLGAALYMLCRPDPAAPYLLLTAGPVPAEAPNLFGQDPEALAFRFEALPQKTWYAETGRLFPAAAAGYVRALVFRLSLGENADFSAQISCGGGQWIPLCAVRRAGEDAFSVTVNTPRCADFRLRLSGAGDCAVYGVDIISETAGEVKGLV